MTNCIPCQTTNPNEAHIKRAEKLGMQWAVSNAQPSFNIVRQKNGAYTWKSTKDNIDNFELITTVYV